MPVAARNAPPREPVYRPMFPDWTTPRPLSFFFLEELLEARSQSAFPTGAVEYDEDVNIYLADMLTRMARQPLAEATFGSWPQWQPPPKSLGRPARARWYLEQGEQRLLNLGLFGRGEDKRRRTGLWGMSPEESRRRDMVCGKACFEAAASLLEHGRRPASLATTAAKIARHFADYVQVLATLGAGRWDLGARLSERQMVALIGNGPSASSGQPRARKRKDTMDPFLDALGRYQRRPSDQRRHQVLSLAREAGVDPLTLDI